MGAAEVIAFEEVRARKQWDVLRGQLHTRFDQWLDRLEEQLQEPAPSLAQVTETVWNLRQALTGSLSETMRIGNSKALLGHFCAASSGVCPRRAAAARPSGPPQGVARLALVLDRRLRMG